MLMEVNILISLVVLKATIQKELLEFIYVNIITNTIFFFNKIVKNSSCLILMERNDISKTITNYVNLFNNIQIPIIILQNTYISIFIIEFYLIMYQY